MIQNLPEEVEKITQWIRDYVKKAGAKGVVIGNSGGKDCATVMALAAKALGSDKVLAVAMPCHSIPEDLEDAKLVANAFYIPMIEIEISKIYDTTEYIDTGKTEASAMKKIEKKYFASQHKRKEIPIYPYSRKNYLEERLEKKEHGF